MSVASMSVSRRMEGLLRVVCGGLSLLLFVAVLQPASIRAQDPELAVRTLDPIAQRGDVIEVQVAIGSPSSPVDTLNGVGFELTYNPNVLAYKDYQMGSVFAPVSGNTQEIGPRDTGSALEYSVTIFFGAAPLEDVAGEVVRFRFDVKGDAPLRTADLALRNADRSTGTRFGLPLTLVDDEVTVSTTRRQERHVIDPSTVSDGSNEVQFRGGSLLTLDFASMSAQMDARMTRIVEPYGGTVLPSANGSPQHRALNAYWTLSQAGTAGFTTDACFALSDLMVTVPDQQALRIYTRASASDAWAEVTSELRPSTTPTHLCATGLSSFSQFTVAAPQGHNRTMGGTDGTGNDTGWRSLAIPTTVDRIALEDDLDFEVDSGALLQQWDGSQYVAMAAPDATLERGRGFMLYVFDDDVDPIPGAGRRLDLPASSEDQSATVTVSGLSTSDTFHLLGNPYDVAYSLSGLAGGDLSTDGFQQTVQVWDPNPPGPGQFDTVTQGVGDDQIAAWQSFFVQRSSTGSGATSLSFDPSGRGTGPGTLRGDKQAAALAQALIHLNLEVAGDSTTIARDGVTLLMDERAADGWDALEATQLAPPNTDRYVTLSSPLTREATLVHRALASEPYPSDPATRTVPLAVQSVGTTGTATLAWPEDERTAVPSNWTVELEDTHTGDTVNLRTTGYTFDVAAGDGSLSVPGDARLRLHVTPATAIPVELVTLEATRDGENVRLRWTTASETNNAGFHVQRRPAARPAATWRRLGFVDGSGTTDAPRSYTFTDTDVPYAADSLAYRLRQIDTDGTVHRSREVVVGIDGPDRVVLHAPAPTPAREQVRLRYDVPTPVDVRIAVYDVLGRRVATWTDARTTAGRHAQTVRLQGLAAGMYFVRLTAGPTTQTRRLTVVR